MPASPGIQPCTALGAVVRGNIHSPRKLVVTGSAATSIQAAPLSMKLFMALLFSMIRLPDPIRDTHQRARQLHLEVARLVLTLSRKRGTIRFSDEQGLNDQLCNPSRRALNRSLFTVASIIRFRKSSTVFIRVWFAPHVKALAPGLKPNMVSAHRGREPGAGGSDFRRG